MFSDISLFLTAFLLGLLGSVHCAGMCGGIIGVLHNSQKILPSKTSNSHLLITTLAFNGGRILSYAVAGALTSLLSFSILEFIGAKYSAVIMQLLAGSFMILLGLYLAAWWNGLSLIEKLGHKLWAYIQPLTRSFLPIYSYKDAMIVGGLWGWIPCGLVYSALVLVMTSGNPLSSAIAMMLFGLGTLPMTAAIGLSSTRINLIKNPIFRRSAGILIIFFGVQMFLGNPLNIGVNNHQPLLCHADFEEAQ